MYLKRILLAIFWIISPLILLSTDYYTATTGLNVRTGPGKGYAIIYTLQKGDQVEVLSKSGKWYKIKYSNNIGYTSSRHLKSSSDISHSIDQYFNFVLIIFGIIAVWLIKRWRFEVRRKKRQDYYRYVYLNSDEWQRKRHLVLTRDNWRCVYCGGPATQVHHKRYAKRIGNEPISWLVSICQACHNSIHHLPN